MHIVAPNETSSAIRYKAVTQLEKKARLQLSDLIAGYNADIALLPATVRAAAEGQLKVLAQKAILMTFENRMPEMEKDFGYDWEDSLESMNQVPERKAVAKLILGSMGDLEKNLARPEVRSRIIKEWLHFQTAGRFAKFTPYLTWEEEELNTWKAKCPDAYRLAQDAAARESQKIQDKSRPYVGGEPSLSNDTRQLSYLAHMIAARKLYLAATNTPEFFEEQHSFVDVTAPAGTLPTGETKIACRMGFNPKPIDYHKALPEEQAIFEKILSSRTQILTNLQEKIVPWTSKKGMSQKLSPNLMSKVYFNVVRPGLLAKNPDVAVETALGGQNYKLLQFLTTLAPEQLKVYSDFYNSNPAFQEFTDNSEVTQELLYDKLDRSVVEMSLSETVIGTLIDEFEAYKGQSSRAYKTQQEKAFGFVPAVIDDLQKYHTFLLRTDHVATRSANFFKSFLEKRYEQNLSPAQRSKRESFYKPVAVVLAAKPGEAGPIPADWKKIDTYIDAVTGMPFTDYSFETKDGTAIICLAQGASPKLAAVSAQDLLDLGKPARINDKETRVKGVRLSELFFNELKSSCLRPCSIARSQFYTSFTVGESVGYSKGAMKEPTLEMLVEALKPCGVFRYTDTYSRLKPAEMVRVKYRTPTGEASNPCWDASQAISGLTAALVKERLADPKWTLVLIEGEKKAAMLAQMAQELKLPYHVIAIPGVWMAMVGAKDNKVLNPFFAEFVMQQGQEHRKALIFFDNDKAFNVNVTHALVQTADCLQKRGSDVFVPNLPFGKKIKGADDFAQVYCRTPEGINYGPLVEILENAVYVPIKVHPIKPQTPDQQRKVKQYMHQAEVIHDLQETLKKSPEPEKTPDFKRLLLLQGRYLLNTSNEQRINSYFEQLSAEAKAPLVAKVLTENPALDCLKNEMRAHIPNFDTGISLKEAVAQGEQFKREDGAQSAVPPLSQASFQLA